MENIEEKINAGRILKNAGYFGHLDDCYWHDQMCVYLLLCQ